MTDLVISVFELMGKSPVLAGAPRGEEAFSLLVAKVSSVFDDPVRIFLDFKGTNLVTPSFFRQAVLNFRIYCREIRRNLYPLVANVTPETVDEILTLIEPKGDTLLVCDLTDASSVLTPRLLGRLDEKQRIALDAVIKAGEADAVSLARIHKDVEPTAWNNRLTALAAKAILVELRKGRAKYYRTLVEM